MTSVPLLLAVCLLAMPVDAQEHKIVVGTRNADLAEGARALREGDSEEGIRLTLAGLQHALGSDERVLGRSNLCAGYILQQRYAEALTACNRALAEDDTYWRAHANRALVYVQQGQYDRARADLDAAAEVAPQARTVKAVRALLHDRLNPVEPAITIDDRRRDNDE